MSSPASHPAVPAEGGPPPSVVSEGPGRVVVAAPAKLNLFFEVLGKRPDGYHEVETLLVAVDLFDTLEVADDPAGRLTLACDAPGVPAGPGNLAYTAAERLRAAFAPNRGATLRLTKRTPHQAGLGGGSSDAAAALIALNRLWGLGLPAAELAKVAAGLGSDVPFFLSPPAGWGEGRGERVTPEVVGRPIDFVVVKPAAGLSTAEVYRRVTVPAARADGSAARAALRAGDANALGAAVFNRLREPAADASPAVAEALSLLKEAGPLGCEVSGSGSAVFGVCRSRADAERIARAVRAAAPPGERSEVFVVRSWP